MRYVNSLMFRKQLISNLRRFSHKIIDLPLSGRLIIITFCIFGFFIVFTSFSKWLVTSITLVALVLSSAAYSYPMKMEGMVMNMPMEAAQNTENMTDCMSDCHSSKNNDISYMQCDMSSMSMNNSHHCSDKGDSCCKTICVVSVYALPIGLTAYTNATASVIVYAQYNEQIRSFTSSSLYRPPIA